MVEPQAEQPGDRLGAEARRRTESRGGRARLDRGGDVGEAERADDERVEAHDADAAVAGVDARGAEALGQRAEGVAQLRACHRALAVEPSVLEHVHQPRPGHGVLVGAVPAPETGQRRPGRGAEQRGEQQGQCGGADHHRSHRRGGRAA